MMRRFMAIGVAVCVTLAMCRAAAYGEVTINVDFNGGAGSGTFSGIGAAPDTGTIWNGFRPLGGFVTTPPLVDSIGAPTAVTVSLESYNVYDAAERPAAFSRPLLTDFIYQTVLGPGGPPGLFAINNLTPDATYDLYFYSQNGGYSNTATSFTIDGATKIATNINPFAGGAPAFVENTNYVVFTGVVASGGVIVGEFNDVAAANNAAFNGLQIRSAGEPPPPPPPPSLLLNENIGRAPGDFANDFMGAGNRVNLVGTPSNTGPTSLAQGPGTLPAFDFNSAFADSLDRTIGVSPNAGPYVPRDRKFDSATASPLVLDYDNDGDFADETPQTGFGMHADAFITFDLSVIRAENGLSADQALRLTGEVGIANFRPGQQFGNNTDAAAILVDGQEMRLYDFEDSDSRYYQFDTTSLVIPGTARYLSFAGLVGTDQDISGAHLGFANMQLSAVPEPSTMLLVSIGLGIVPLIRRRRK